MSVRNVGVMTWISYTTQPHLQLTSAGFGIVTSANMSGVGRKRAVRGAEEGEAVKDNNQEDNMENTCTFTFSWALHQLKEGSRVQREGWNGKGMFLFLVPGSTFKVNRAPLLGIYPEGTEINYHAHVDMKTANGQIVPWLCSQTDMLADDWKLA